MKGLYEEGTVIIITLIIMTFNCGMLASAFYFQKEFFLFNHDQSQYDLLLFSVWL